MSDSGSAVSCSQMAGVAATRTGACPGSPDGRPERLSPTASGWPRWGLALLLLCQLALIAGGDWYIVGNQMMSADSMETGKAGIIDDSSGSTAPTGIAEDLPAMRKALRRIFTPQPFDTDLLPATRPASLSTFPCQDR